MNRDIARLILEDIDNHVQDTFYVYFKNRIVRMTGETESLHNETWHIGHYVDGGEECLIGQSLVDAGYYPELAKG